MVLGKKVRRLLRLVVFCWVAVAGSTLPANQDLQRARQDVLSALVKVTPAVCRQTISPQSMGPANVSSMSLVDHSAHWSVISASIVRALAACENVDRQRLAALAEQLEILEYENAAWAPLRRAVMQWQTQLPESELTRLLANARIEAAQFTPMDRGAIQTLQLQLQQDLQHLGRSRNLDVAWRKFLAWEESMRAANSASAPSTRDMSTLRVRWSNAFTALPVAEVKAVQQSVIQLALATAGLEAEESSSTRIARIDRLETLLSGPSAFADGSSLEDVESIYERLCYLGQAPQLSAALARKFSHANMIVRVATGAVMDQVAQPVAQSFPIDARYAGTPVTGSGQFSGNQAVMFLPSANHVAADIRLSGQTIAHTRGGRSGVSVASTGTTSLSGGRGVTFAGFGPPRWALPQATATTQIQFDRISTNLPWFKRKAAARQVYASRSASEAQASQDASGQLRRELKTTTDRLSGRGSLEVLDDFRDTLFAGDVSHTLVRCGSYPKFIDWRLWQAPPGRFAAPQAFPDLPLDYPVQVMLHESFLEFTAASKLASKSVRAGESLGWLSDVPAAGNLSEKTGGPQSPTSTDRIQFADSQPVSLKIEAGQLVARLNLARIESDADTFLNYVVLVTYRPTIDSGTLRLVAEDEIQVLPAGFDPSQGKKLGGRRLNLCRLIERRLAAFVTQDVVLPELKLGSGQPQDEDRLLVSRVSVADAWLEICFGSLALQEESVTRAIPFTRKNTFSPTRGGH